MESSPSTQKSVLIAEDDALLLVTLTHQFEDAGYRVITATDGEDGVAKFLSEHPDAVVMDIMMPRKDGVEMLEEIREKAPDSKTPFIVLSNANDMDYVARAMGQGAVAYLLKSDRQIDSVVKLVEERIGKP
ncbi:MAG TPA: response regulator [Candidatus Paceibacterota bacterium]|jgi:DNA-binding response OmpR family regulator|nr:response regulator [Candidatus Paceibacterota bacterium]